MGGRWFTPTTSQCGANTKHTEGALKGKDTGERCKRAALPGRKFCRLHGQVHNPLLKESA